jgi:hypothetical protein
MGARSDEARLLLRKTEFQEAVGKLEPFETLGFTKAGLGWSTEIRNESVLTHAFVDDVFSRLQEVLSLITNLC